MVKIDYQPKLDFNQVLITPKRSTINSRKDVDIYRKFTFKNGQTWYGVPIMCANMATTGTFEVYNVLSQYSILTCLHKFYTPEDFVNYENDEKRQRRYLHGYRITQWTLHKFHLSIYKTIS